MPQSFRPPNTRSRKYNELTPEPIRLSLSVRPGEEERHDPRPRPVISGTSVSLGRFEGRGRGGSRIPSARVGRCPSYPLHDAIDADAVRCTQPWERRLSRRVAVRDKCRPARAPLARYRSLWLFASVQLRHTRYSRRVYSHSPQCTTPTPTTTIYYH
jgi:hypothetical protein